MDRRAEHAHVADGARLAADVVVGPGVVVEDDVEVGPGTVLQAGAVLHAGTRIGARCRIGPYAVIGGTPMDRNFAGERSLVVLGEEVVVREFATINRATGTDAVTRVGDRSLVMCYVHVGHNAQVGRECVLTNGVQIGGHAEVGERAVLGGGTLIHQFARIGAYAMVGGDSAVNSDVLPYSLAHGSPARHYRANRVGLQRRGFDASSRQRIETALRHLRRRDDEAFAALADAHEDVAVLRAFIASSKRGVARFVGRE